MSHIRPPAFVSSLMRARLSARIYSRGPGAGRQAEALRAQVFRARIDAGLYSARARGGRAAHLGLNAATKYDGTHFKCRGP